MPKEKAECEHQWLLVDAAVSHGSPQARGYECPKCNEFTTVLPADASPQKLSSWERLKFIPAIGSVAIAVVYLAWGVLRQPQEVYPKQLRLLNWAARCVRWRFANT